jgi:hypothetical protein
MYQLTSFVFIRAYPRNPWLSSSSFGISQMDALAWIIQAEWAKLAHFNALFTIRGFASLQPRPHTFGAPYGQSSSSSSKPAAARASAGVW